MENGAVASSKRMTLLGDGLMYPKAISCREMKPAGR
jgi:hypothetical protein